MRFFKNPILEDVKAFATASRALTSNIHAGNHSATLSLSVIQSPEMVEIAEQMQFALDHLHTTAIDRELRLDLVTQAIHVGLWDMTVVAGDPVNPNNEFIWSDELRRMLGYRDQTDFPNVLDSWASKLHPDEQGWVLDAFAKHLTDHSGRTPYDIEYRLQLKNGEYRWFKATGTTKRDEHGVPLRVVGALFDIHEKKLTDQELQSFVTKYDLISQVLTEASWDIVYDDSTLESFTMWYSPQFRQTLGYKDEADFPNLFESFSDRLHPDDKDTMLRTFAESLHDYSGKTPFDMEYRLRLKSGEYRWFHAKGNTARDRNGVPLRLAGTIRDITIEKNKEQAIQAMNESMKQLSDSIAEMVKAIESVTVQAQEMATSQEQSMAAANNVKESTDETKNISIFIRGIAEQTNLLGLNASIEAARAGEMGRGFGVVADEVRKLAVNSAEATGNIEKSLNNMNQYIDQIVDQISTMTSLTHVQAAVTQQLNASVEEINVMSQSLVTIAKSI